MNEKEYKEAQERLHYLVFVKKKQSKKEKIEIEVLKEKLHSYQDENIDPLNEGHYHEIIDRIDCQNTIIENLLLSHPTLTKRKYEEQRKKVIKAQKLLSEVYQYFGKESSKLFLEPSVKLKDL